MEILKVFGLFVVTAIAEIVGCYLPYLFVKKGGSVFLLIPATFSLAVFTYLLTLHPQYILKPPFVPRRPIQNIFAHV